MKNTPSLEPLRLPDVQSEAQEGARRFLSKLLEAMKSQQASDLFLTVGFPPAFKVDGKLTPINETKLEPSMVQALASVMMNNRQKELFQTTKESNFAHVDPVWGRFRVNVFSQKNQPGMVLRVINTAIPSMEGLGLPSTLKKIAMAQRGLVLFVGATGSGKSTSLAAMIGHRNQHSYGHIITIEDPIEFVHEHGNCVVTQREIGVDTESWESALKNTLRQAPNVILIGEIRDEEAMGYALKFAETGHLCMATLHANNANQALDRILSFFPEERKHQALLELSLNLRAMVSQRLVARDQKEGRAAAIEIMLNTPFISKLVAEGNITGIKDAMKSEKTDGMITFDEALFNLFEQGDISQTEALANADNPTDLLLSINLSSKRARTQNATTVAGGGFSFEEDEESEGKN